jgi:hypothetical protein
VGTGTDIDDMCAVLRGYADVRYPKYTSSNIVNTITASLNNGYPLIAHVNGKNKPGLYYYNIHTNDVAGGHYICVFGYDPITGLIAVSDCHYNSTFFGIHLINETNLFQGMSGKTGILAVN